MIAVLYVETNGIYRGMQGISVWDVVRDARRYAGPYPVVAHPPCERWGRFWHGSPRKPHRFQLGDVKIIEAHLRCQCMSAGNATASGTRAAGWGGCDAGRNERAGGDQARAGSDP